MHKGSSNHNQYPVLLYNKDSVTASGEGIKSHSSLVSPFCTTNLSAVLGSSSSCLTQDDGICIHCSTQNRLFPGSHLTYTSESFCGQSSDPYTGVSRSIRQRVIDRLSVQWTQANRTRLHCNQVGLAISAKVRAPSFLAAA